jgi:hypothetical protein
MYTMYTRASGLGAVVLLSVIGAASCGGDEPTASPGDLSCMPMTQSIPNSAADPCPQDDPKCPPPMYAAVSTCMPTGTWNTQCACVLASTLGMSGGGGIGGARACGNGTVEPAMGETCEPSVPVATNCMMMGMGIGAVSCNPATCTYNTSSCMAAPGGTAGDGA